MMIGMSDSPLSASVTEASRYTPYDRPSRQVLAALPADVRAAWRSRYGVEDDAELRVHALLDRAEAALQSARKPATIRTVWIALADRAGASNDTDLLAAAALAGMAMGLRLS